MFDKKLVTAKFLRGYAPDLYYCGYCEAQYILRGMGAFPVFYTHGIYGWNFDAYLIHVDGKIICFETGYRRMSGIRVNFKNYNEIAKKIVQKYNFSKDSYKVEKICTWLFVSAVKAAKK
nr:MAG TPA: hypothetical protein [Caudoviricetes sp.]